jgi:hypothetical protein
MASTERAVKVFGAGLAAWRAAGRVVAAERSLALRSPKVASEWHPQLNAPATPQTVSAGSPRKYWFVCEKGHEWKATLYNRVSHGTGCPGCRGRHKSFAEEHPELLAEWSPKNALDPTKVLAMSNKRAIFKCDKGADHEWHTTIASRSLGSGCPFCAGNRVSSTNSLEARRPDLTAFWHPRNKFGPHQVTRFSNQWAWFKCPRAEAHEWEAPIARLNGCIFCAGHRVTESDSLVKALPEAVAKWHPTLNEVAPEGVSIHSNRQVYLACAEGPDHVWTSTVGRLKRAREVPCPFCANERLSHTNSVQARLPSMVPFWHPTKNGVLTPIDVIFTSQRKVWWQLGGPEGPQDKLREQLQLFVSEFRMAPAELAAKLGVATK